MKKNIEDCFKALFGRAPENTTPDIIQNILLQYTKDKHKDINIGIQIVESMFEDDELRSLYLSFIKPKKVNLSLQEVENILSL
jgi:hypothetical protein